MSDQKGMSDLLLVAETKSTKILFSNKNTLNKEYYLHLKQQSMTQVT